MHSRRRVAFAWALVVGLAACGGGGGGGGAGGGGDKACKACKPDSLVGVAAGGAPIAGALAVVDSAGVRRSATIAADGTFALDVGGMTGPFLIEVAGLVGGRPTVVHSLALAGDVGTQAVNVTPLTELLTAFVLGRDPRQVFTSASPDLSGVTAAKLADAEALLAAKLAPVLQAYGVAGANVRTQEFSADSTGLDGALDAVKVTPVQDAATGDLRYQLVIATSLEPVVLDPSQLGSLSLGSLDPALMTQLAVSLPAIDARLQQLAALYASAVPAADALRPYFNAGAFRHNGLGLDDYLAKVLRVDAFAGATFGRAAVEALDGADHLKVSFTVTFRSAAVAPRHLSWWMRKVDGAWLSEGNGQVADVAVNYLARLTARPLTWDELAAREDLERFIDRTGHRCYQLKGGSQVSVDTLIYPSVCDTDGNLIGTLALGGWWPYTDWQVPGLREATRAHSEYLGQPSAAIRPYLVLWVSSTELDPRTDHVKVRGPGLPDAGVTLTRPKASIPRDYLILEGDYYDWNAFDTLRCGEMHPAPASCAMDWSQVKAGGLYTYAFFDASNPNPFESITVELLGRPRPPAEWLADRDRLFPQFHLAPAQQFSLSNILDPASGFREGGTVTVDWSVPPDPTVQMDSLWIWREYYRGNVFPDDAADSHHVKESHAFPLRGTTTVHQACTFDGGTGGALTSWAWATLTAVDVYGNQIHHEVAPENPY